MIKVKLMGGLGNQMFQYAVGKNLALKNYTDLVLDLTFLHHRLKNANYVFRDYDLDIFASINPKTTVLSKLPKPFHNMAYILQAGMNKMGEKIFPKQYLAEKRVYEFDSTILESGANVFLTGYWQNEKYFKEIQEIIRNDFSHFRYPLSEKAKILLEEIKNTNSVCINFRRTDYLTINTFVGDMDGNYYDNAVKLIGEKMNPPPQLFVFSDDIEWCKENFKSAYPITFVDHSYAGKKFSDYFQLMLACKQYIIPNSTFAWWAAWLNPSAEKIVIAPKVWIASKDFDSSAMVPKEWIRI